MYKISSSTYIHLAEILLERITSRALYSGVIEFELDDADIKFVSTIIPYFRREVIDDAEIYTLRDIIPVWWEVHTTTLDGEVFNDFDFETFKEYVCQ